MGLSKSGSSIDPPEFGAAADGDADRNMILGKRYRHMHILKRRVNLPFHPRSDILFHFILDFLLLHRILLPSLPQMQFNPFLIFPLASRELPGSIPFIACLLLCAFNLISCHFVLHKVRCSFMFLYKLFLCICWL